MASVFITPASISDHFPDTGSQNPRNPQIQSSDFLCLEKGAQGQARMWTTHRWASDKGRSVTVLVSLLTSLKGLHAPHHPYTFLWN